MVGLLGFAVGVASVGVALLVVVLHPLPAAIFVDVGNDLTTVDPGNELHRLVASVAGCGATRLDYANYCAALGSGCSCTHTKNVGSSDPALEPDF